MFPDYYKTLGIHSSVTKKNIKKSYRKLALEFHPDRNKSPNAHKKFIEINEAYLILYMMRQDGNMIESTIIIFHNKKSKKEHTMSIQRRKHTRGIKIITKNRT